MPSENRTQTAEKRLNSSHSRRRGRWAAFPLVLLTLAMPAHAGGTTGGALRWCPEGFLYSRIGNDLRRDEPYEAMRYLDTRARLENRFDWEDAGLHGMLGGQLRYELFDLSDSGYASPAFDLREAYLEMRQPRLTLSAGRQIVTWSKLDDLMILDQINPQDYRWFMLYDKQERKLPISMLRAAYHGDGWELETLALPYFEPSKVDFLGNDWSVFGPFRKAAAHRLPPQFAPMAQAVGVERDYDKFVAEGAIRLRTNRRAVDYGLSLMSIHDRMPAIRERTSGGRAVKALMMEPDDAKLLALGEAALGPEDFTLSAYNQRILVAGADFETVVGEYGLRGEAGFFKGMPYTRHSDFAAIRKDKIAVGLGADHWTTQEFYINLQVAVEWVLDYEKLVGTRETTPQIVLNLAKDLHQGDYTLDLKGAYGPTDGDWMLHPSLRYKATDNLHLTLGAMLFGGKRTALFGHYKDTDHIYAELKYSF